MPGRLSFRLLACCWAILGLLSAHALAARPAKRHAEDLAPPALRLSQVVDRAGGPDAPEPATPTQPALGAPLDQRPIASAPAAGLFLPVHTAMHWSLLRRDGLSPRTLLELHEEWLVNSGNAWEFLDDGDAAPVPRVAAAVRAQRLSHERSTTLSLAQRFAAAEFELGLEGLFSEPMLAQRRPGRPPLVLRRAGSVLGFRLGNLHQRTGIFARNRFGRPALARGPKAASARVWRLSGGLLAEASMTVEGHARRWLGHGERPHLDARWHTQAAWVLSQADGERLMHLGLGATWRQVAGARGQVVQVGSFPIATDSAPYVLYEPLIGFEDLARYTAHVFATDVRGEVRLTRSVSAGAFLSATLVDRFSRQWRDHWLVAAGPMLTASLHAFGRDVLVEVRSAHRAGDDQQPWLHLITLGV